MIVDIADLESQLIMPRTICKLTKCRKWKNLDDNGFCPDHISTDPAADQSPEVCNCSICSLVVNDDDLAINCELCNEWYHISCSNIGETLYELIDPEEGDRPVGFQWYCGTCLPIINTLKQAHRNKRDSNLQHVSTGVQFDNQKTPVCEDYRHGVCSHGMSGKKAVGDEQFCSFRHPKKCEKYCKYGIDPNYGCTFPNCKFLHPILCRYSVRQGSCKNEKCTFTHLKGTKRNKKAVSNHTHNQRRYQQKYSDSRGSYSKFDKNNLGFYDYPAQKYADRISNNINFQNPNYYNSQNQDYRYQEGDFSPFETAEQNKQNSLSAHPNFTEGFLDLQKVVKAVQESQVLFQKNFQAELESIKVMLSPQLPKQQLQFTQPPTHQHHSHPYHAQAHPQNTPPQFIQSQSVI